MLYWDREIFILKCNLPFKKKIENWNYTDKNFACNSVNFFELAWKLC